QVLTKTSNADGAIAWTNIPEEVPDGGTTGQVLAKASATDKDVTWVDPPTSSGDSIEHVEITKSNYDALSQAEKEDPTKIYLILDGGENYITVNQGITYAGYVLTVNDEGNVIPKMGSGVDELPSGGTTGQVLAKASATDKDVTWVSPTAGTNGLPNGGTTGQMLIKASSVDGDANWNNIPEEVPTGGNAGQLLGKASATDKDVTWVDPPSTSGGGIPNAGLTGQVLTKTSTVDGAVAWVNVPIELPSAGTKGQLLAKKTNTTGDVEWVSPSSFTGVDHIDLTSAEYWALTQSEKEDPTKLYLITDDLPNYVLENQGSTNSGKILGINSAGLVAPVEPSGGSGTVEWPTGGTTGQVLAKASSTDGDVEWMSIPEEIPTGGTTDQVLAKSSNTNGAVKWMTIPNGIPVGGSTGQVLGKASATDQDVAWLTISSSGTGGKAPSTDPTNTSKKYMALAVYDSATSAWTYVWEEVIY
ncbi:MAG: hypothetical protein LBD57_04175, partial [Endomicrobium sp.]|nr:hypothetical protein [Endomicrobium sp.]